MKSARAKVDQVKATGAELLVTSCENCHTQLNSLNDHYSMGVDVLFLTGMVSDALVQWEMQEVRRAAQEQAGFV